MTKLICSECGVEVFLCDHCTESFIESIKIYCAFKSEKHYCYDDFVKIGIEPTKIENYLFFSCIGRFIDSTGTIFNKKSPCNYTNGGLFDLSKIKVIDEEGVEHSVFEFSGEQK